MSNFYKVKKPIKVINSISKELTGIQQLPQAQVQYLDKEIIFSGSNLFEEKALLLTQKALVGGITGLLPLLTLVMARGDSDPELDNLAGTLFQVMKLLTAGHVQSTLDRRANVKSVVNSLLGKEIIRQEEDVHGDLLPVNEFLLGGRLGDKNKEVLKAARASDQCLGTKTAQSGKRSGDKNWSKAPFKHQRNNFRGSKGKSFGRSFHSNTQNNKGGSSYKSGYTGSNTNTYSGNEHYKSASHGPSQRGKSSSNRGGTSDKPGGFKS